MKDPSLKLTSPPMMTTITAAEVGSLAKDPFVAALGGIYESSPWVAERAHAAGSFTQARMRVMVPSRLGTMRLSATGATSAHARCARLPCAKRMFAESLRAGLAEAHGGLLTRALHFETHLVLGQPRCAHAQEPRPKYPCCRGCENRVSRGGGGG